MGKYTGELKGHMRAWKTKHKNTRQDTKTREYKTKKT